MTEEDLIYLKKWFSDYTKSFYSSDEGDQRNIMLKVEHTRHVCRNIIDIGRDLSLKDNEMMLAETVAIFHDIGRFPQYAKYKTFKDAVSVNHGLLGVKTLIQEKILENLLPGEQELITQAVKFHCAIAVPTAVEERIKFFIKLIRDADKLDVYRVFIEFYESPDDQKASATAHGVPDTPGYSERILASIKNKTIAPYSEVRNLNDFKLMKLSWVYDLNFRGACKLLQERGYVNSLAQVLPQTDEIRNLIKNIREFISERLHNVEKV
ncbi:MAG TPA: HD domain-containing protein [Nitrospirae bacterium]|nr:HD domain-containing protein [Nitrospirota bacterium]